MTDQVPQEALCLVSLLAIRIGSALRLVPFFGGRPMPIIPWISLSILLACVVVPWSGSAPSVEFGSLAWLALASKELFIGIFLGIMVRIAFSVLELAGNFVGISRAIGSQLSDFTDTPISSAYVILASALFLVLGGHHALLSSLLGTVRCLPPGTLIGAASLTSNQFEPAVRLFASSMGAAVFVSIPIFTAGIIADVITGTISKFAPSPTFQGGSHSLRNLFVQIAAVATLGFVASFAIDFLQSTLSGLNICPI